MKRKFIGRVKDYKFIRWFLFWITVRKKRRHYLERDIKKMHAELSSLRCSMQQMLEKLECYSTLTALQIKHMRTSDVYARLHHPEVFEKYRGIHRGRDIVIVGAGPTLDAYTPIPDAIHIGVNRTYQCEKLSLDYLFAQDGGPVTEVPELTNYRRGKCRKFFGVHPMMSIMQISEAYVTANDAEKYYFYNAPPADPAYFVPLDIAHQPFLCSYSVIACAFQFALWCQPRRIYLVGCDCSSAGYFKGDSGICAQGLPTDELRQEWKCLAEFAKRCYRDIEIISINPVGLRGLFKDLDTNKEEE